MPKDAAVLNECLGVTLNVSVPDVFVIPTIACVAVSRPSTLKPVLSWLFAWVAGVTVRETSVRDMTAKSSTFPRPLLYEKIGSIGVPVALPTPPTLVQLVLVVEKVKYEFEA